MSQERLKQAQQRFLVVDDHEAILEGTVPALKNAYPDVEIITAQDRAHAQQKVELYHPELVVIDLSIPEKPYAPANPEVGIQFLKALMSTTPAPNIMVLSTDIKPLVRLKPMINAYEGGFAAMDKSLPIREMLKLIDMALRGSIHLPRQVRARPEFDRKWLEVLSLKFEAGLTDKAIAQRLGVSDRTVRNYWIRIQDTLGVYDEPEKDLRLQIQIEARKIGLIN
ncbi:MAG: response regulator transcription factor [Symploca sp. SIO3C6]|uniref:Response regulator transcription factor n=1 Tax=Symploca sp. SIO1C4 TaxID=2607765 RepID=A0A6B3N9M2_9CYAN|nr:response regulator transcription factor [Symploca sp. SIO3C6]NER28193.1 response regulator transcription factor [Symploca sp. SIO1C4]NET06093.1 response regulator transcription factor [Symploca sp. SIO2B6]NET52318.1 response regulator transcription factor [Merismopedia sp. SIO2A8]